MRLERSSTQQRLIFLSTIGLVAGLAMALIPEMVDAQRRRGGRRARANNNAAAAPAQASTPAQAQASESSEGGRPQCAGPATGGVCIDNAITTRVNACGNLQGLKLGDRRKNAPASHLSTSKREKADTKREKAGPGFEADVSLTTGRQRVQAREEALLRRELQLLDRLVTNMRRDNALRPESLLRLAETRFEMQQSITRRIRGFDEQIFQSCEQEKNANRCRELRTQQEQAEGELRAQREAAIRNYATLVTEHDNFPRMDEVLFSLGFALEEMRQFDDARQVYYRLIKGFPQSKYIPNAYLSFAEYYFAEGQMSEALSFYQKVTEIPPDRNPVYGFALYKSAWTLQNMERHRDSLQAFVQVIEYANGSSAPDAANLSRQARRELVLPYSQVGNPRQALDFFRRYAANEDQAFEMFESLGELYFDTGQWPNTMSVYHDLISARSTNDKVCYWQTRVANAVVSSRPKPEQVREVERLTDLLDVFMGQQHTPESKTICKQSASSILIELATAWHREAVGTDTQPGTNDRGTMGQSVRLYDLLLEKFPDMENLQYPDIDRRDWPTAYRVAYFRAELLWALEDFDRCGPAFDKVIELDPQGEYTGDALLSSILCWDKKYQLAYQSRERETRGERTAGNNRRREQPEETDMATRCQNDLKARELTEDEQAMLRAFDRFACLVPRESEMYAELPKVKYRRARIYYQANHFEEASILFKDMVWNHRDHELADFAGNLYLDSLNVIGQCGPKPACYDTMETDSIAMKEMYCSQPSSAAEHSELCTPLGDLICQIKRKKAEAVAACGDFKGGARLGKEWVRECRTAAQPEAVQQVLWNIAIWYESAKLVGQAIDIRRRLIQAYPESELAKFAVYLIGANLHAIARYAEAADYYEQYATRYPTQEETPCEPGPGLCGNARTGLNNAILFRMGLGDDENRDKAIHDVELFERNYKNRHARETAAVVFALGAYFESRRDWAAVVDHYRGFLRTYGRSALPSQLIQANVKIARALREMPGNGETQAVTYYRDAVTTWGRDAMERIRSADVSDSTKTRAVTDARSGACEAYFHQAENLYQAFNRIPFPPFRGDPNMENVTRYSTGTFRQWVERKKAALDAAEAAYNLIVPICNLNEQSQLAPVPEWLIASASRVGQMYTSFVDAFDGAPVPTEIQSDQELYEVYATALNEARQRFFDIAIPKFEYCLTTATTLRWFNQYSTQCEEYLNRLSPADYPVAAELRGSPTYVHRGEARPGAVELGAEEEEAAEAPAAGAAAAPTGGAQ